MCSYDLQYTDYNINLANGLQELLETSDTSDITLAVGGKLFKAHQVILSIFSPYFKEIFCNQLTKHAIFYMKNVPYRIMRDLLVFMYVGKVQIPEEDLNLLMETANELQIKGLSEVLLIDDEELNSNNVTTTLKRQAEEADTCTGDSKKKARTSNLESVEFPRQETSTFPKTQYGNDNEMQLPIISKVTSLDSNIKQERNIEIGFQEENECDTGLESVNDNPLNDSRIPEYQKQPVDMNRVYENKYFTYEVETIVTRMKNNNSSILEIDGHIYYRHKDIRNDDRKWMRWRCARCNNGSSGRNCRASVRTNPENMLIRTNAHNHPPIGAPEGARIVCRERYKSCRTEMDDTC